MNSNLFLVHRSENGNGVFAARLKLGDQLIGRAVENEICLTLDTISRVHARLSVGESGVIVTDLDSRNGTWVNQKRVTCVSVFPGEQIQFGNVQMILLHDPNGVCGHGSEDETRDARSASGNDVQTPLPLHPAQTRVLDLFIEGMIEKQVATKLEISIHTVHNHAKKIYAAYGVRTRVELLLKLIPRGRQDSP